jgi:pimeloyl-ACP methyl ester carboxylesterase
MQVRSLRLSIVTALAGPIVVAALAISPAAAAGIADAIDRLNPHPCYSGDLICVTIRVPLDHDTPTDTRKLDIEFAVHLATGSHRGTLVYFVGGPGQAGVPYGTPAMDWFDPAIPEHYDIVFFDQRGIGPRHGVECVEASGIYWSTYWDFTHVDTIVADVEQFVKDCVAESGRAEILPYIGTNQAARDIEIFRQAIGAPKIWLYGASYGTYIAQAYAAAYPDAIEAIILDGVMDPANDMVAEGIEGARAGESLFERMAEECSADDDCRRSFESDPLTAYDRIMARLEAAPMEVRFPLTDGRLVPRTLTQDMLFGSLSMSLYTPDDRTAFLQTLATAEHGDFVPLLRMGYRAIEVDPDTLEPASERGSPFGIYWGAFYGISCADYAVAAGDPVAMARAAIEEGLAQRDAYPRFYGYLIGLRPECQFWPAVAEKSPSRIFTGGTYKTLVLAGDADAATPIAQGRAVYGRVPEASMVTVHGGPHVLYGWGDSCVDNVVTEWLVDDVEPQPGNRTCNQTVLNAHYAIDVVGLHQPDEGNDVGWGIIAAIETAILSSGWDEVEAGRIGCSHGGTMTMRPAAGDGGIERYRMESCGIWPGVEVTGIAIYRESDERWGWEMSLELDGAHTGSLTVDFDFIDGEEEVAGIIDDTSIIAGRSPAAPYAGAPANENDNAASDGEEGAPAAAVGANR